MASNEIKLVSEGGPAYYGSEKFFLRGEGTSYDDTKVLVSTEMAEKVCFAVNEYNKIYGSIQCKCNRAIVCKDCMKNLRSEVLAF